jgi:serine/threonine protein phosphatase PrpC
MNEAGSTPMRHKGYALTDVGRKRKANQDAFYMDDVLGLYVVGDGMGGHAAGEIASQEAVEQVYCMVKRGIDQVKPLFAPVQEEDIRSACRLMESAIQAATYMVFSLAALDRGKSGMGTTLTSILVHGDHVVLGQVGDSRIYRMRKDGVVEQLTEDHTLVAWQLKQGLITEDEAKRSPQRNVITRAVGNRDYVQVDTCVLPIERGDRYLLCSDGLHGYLQDTDIPSIMTLGGDKAVARFVELANDRGGKDNITAVVVEFD